MVWKLRSQSEWEQAGEIEEIQWSTVRQKDVSETEGEDLKTVISLAMLYGAETWATMKRQKNRIGAGM